MALLTYPVPFANLGQLLPILNVDWTLEQFQEISISGNGETLAADLARPLWTGVVTLKPQLVTEARALMAQLEALDGALETFYLANPLGWWPAMDPGGTLYGSSTPQIGAINANKKQISFKGLPIGYVLSPGDMFHVEYGGGGARRGLFRLREGATVSALGTTGSLEFRPHISASAIVDDVVSFARPAAKVKLMPGTLDKKQVRYNKEQITFSVRQTLQAG